MAKNQMTEGPAAPKVSVVVITYNGEAWLGRCVDSLLGQTLTDIEVVLVNDGSTDSTPRIVDEYAARDARVKAIHTENQGPSAARHTGVHAASGEYVALYDDDDYAPADALERMYAKAKEADADIVIGDYWMNRYHGSLDFFAIRQPELTSSEALDALRRWLLGELRGAQWTLLIRRELYTSTIHECVPIHFCEDLVVFVRLWSRAKTVAQVAGEPIYYYVSREQSMASHELPWSAKKVGEHIVATRFVLDYVEQIPQRESIADAIAYYALYHLSLLLIKGKGCGIDFSDLEARIYRDYFPNRTARRRLRTLWPKQYVYLMAERHAGWRGVRRALWGTPLAGKVTRSLARAWRRRP